jgi:hypothetical protein
MTPAALGFVVFAVGVTGLVISRRGAASNNAGGGTPDPPLDPLPPGTPSVSGHRRYRKRR